MIRTIVKAASSPTNRSIKSLALNVHFKQPDLGMKDYEILSRSSAFLLSVDPKTPTSQNDESSPYSHLERSQAERDRIVHQQNYSPEPAGGPKRHAKDLNWLEFCPGKHRPLVHVVSASHVISPWLWKEYYPQEWLSVVKQEHVRYSVDVFNTSANESNNKGAREPLARFALNPYPIHHPTEIDLAILHLKQEETSLEHMKSLGVEIMYLRDNETLFDKGDEVLFDGFELSDDHYRYMDEMDYGMEGITEVEKNKTEEDTRVFIPYTETGKLLYASPARFLSSTSKPLPEGLCGGPVIDTDGNVCGIVEGIVPANHEDKKIAGAASFIPSFVIKEFIDYAERIILEKILPKNVFDKVVNLKDGKGLHSKPLDLNGLIDDNGGGLSDNSPNSSELDVMYDSMIESIKKSRTPEQVEAILATIEREQQEVMEMIQREGGDLDEIIATVRERTREEQRKIFEELAKHQTENEIKQAEIVSKSNDNHDSKSNK